MKCVVCGSEIGTSRYCNMCGADNSELSRGAEISRDKIQPEDNSNEPVFAPHGNGAYQYKNVLYANPNQEARDLEGTIVLTEQQLMEMSQSGRLNSEKKDNAPVNIIPEYQKPKTKKELKKEKKELKKAQQGYVNLVPFVVSICILSVFVIALAAFLIYFIFFGKKEYIEVQPDVDSEVYINDIESNAVMSLGNEMLNNTDKAEKISFDNTAMLYKDADGNLIYENINGSSENFGVVSNYVANDTLSTIVCIYFDGEGYSVDFWNNGRKYKVESGLNDVKDFVVSDENGYFAFYNEYSEEYWKENQRLEAGGEMITVVYRDIYMVNYNGEIKKIYSNEDSELSCHYVTNSGYVFFSDAKDNKVYVAHNGEIDKVGSNFEAIIYYENINQYLMLTTTNDLVYGSVGDRVKEGQIIATGVDALYDIAGNQKQNNYGAVGNWYEVTESLYSYADTPQIVYYQNDSSFFIRPDYMEASIKLSDEDSTIKNVYTWNGERLYYVCDDKLFCMNRKELVIDEKTKQEDIIEEWEEITTVSEECQEHIEILYDGNVLYTKNDALYSYDGSDSKLLFENVENFCANDNSNGFMYVQSGELYYLYNVDNDSPVKLCDVGEVTYLTATNRIVYYYDASSKEVISISVADKEQLVLQAGINNPIIDIIRKRG